MAFAGAVEALPTELKRDLDAMGALFANVLVNLFADDDEVEPFVKELIGESDDRWLDDEVLALKDLVAKAVPLAKRITQVVVSSDGVDISLALHALQEVDKRKLDLKQSVRMASGLVVGRGPKRALEEGRWPVRVRRKERAEGAKVGRSSAENDDRNRWLKALADIVCEAELPVFGLVGRGADRDLDYGAVLRVVGQGRRLRTVRKRITDWRKFRTYLLGAYGRPWPEGVREVLDYLEVRASEPCARTVPSSFLASLAFIEKSGGVPASRQLAAEPCVRSCVDELNMSLAGNCAPGKKVAPRYPLALVVALEEVVVSAERLDYERMLAWWILVKVWGTLRFDDHRGMAPEKLKLEGGTLSGSLTRSKTSGSGKAIESLPLIVNVEAWLVFPGWLAEGFALWEKHSFERDFFLALPSPGLHGLRKVEANYADATSMTRVLFASLAAFVVIKGEYVKKPEKGKLLQFNAQVFWTEHSARATLTSWAACSTGVSASWLDVLGRWGAKGSAVYVRTYSKRAAVVQARVAVRLRTSASSPHDLVDEASVFSDLQEFLVARGIGKDVVGGSCERLRVFKVALGDVVGESPVSLTALTDSSAEEDLDEDDDGKVNCEKLKEEIVVKKVERGYDVRARMGCFVISHGRRRCLHRIGSCWRVPGKDYANFFDYGPDLPARAAYDAICGDCKRGQTFAEEGSSSSSSSSVSSSPSASGS